MSLVLDFDLETLAFSQADPLQLLVHKIPVYWSIFLEAWIAQLMGPLA